MYPVSNTMRDLFWAGYRQVARITFANAQTTITLTESDIIQGKLTIDRYSVSGDKIEVGSAIAGELSLTLNNLDGQFDDVTFEGAELYVQIGVKNWDHPTILVEDALQDSSGGYLLDNLGDRLIGMLETEAPISWIPCGYFIVDEPPRTLSTIKLKALDRMVKFDRTVDPSQLSFPMTVETLVNRCCSLCDVTLSGSLSALPNSTYSITAYPVGEQKLTYRNLIQWCAAIMGTCAFIRWDGLLVFQWYSTANVTIAPGQRYSSDMQEQDITITGVVFQDSEETEYISGTDDYAVNLTGNGLIQANAQTVVDNLGAVLTGFTYRPYTAEIKSSPFLYPMDKITYTDAEGTNHTTIVTHATFLMNGSTGIAGAGETAQRNGYASTGALTNQQAAILANMKGMIETDVSERAQALLQMNETISNSMGLHVTGVVQLDGSTVYYYHDATTLADSTIIYTYRAGGFAWTDDWNNGNPTWKYGFTSQGNAILNLLSVYKLTADQIDAGTITADKLVVGIKLKNGDTSINVGEVPIWSYNSLTGDFNRGSAIGFNVTKIIDVDTSKNATYGIIGGSHKTNNVFDYISTQAYQEKTDTLSNNDDNSYEDDWKLCNRGQNAYLLTTRLTNLFISKLRELTVTGDSFTSTGRRVFAYGMGGIMYGQKTYSPNPSADDLKYCIDPEFQFYKSRTGFCLTEYHFYVRAGSHYFDLSSSGLSVDGNPVAYTSSSSLRYKHSITDKLNADLDPHKLYDLPVKQFIYNDDHLLQYRDMKGKTLPGFIAEDVAEIYPAAVIYGEDGQVESWDERRIIPGLLALVQEQRKQITQLEDRISRLEALLTKGGI